MEILIKRALIFLDRPEPHCEPADLYIRDGAIAGIGTGLPEKADKVIDGRDKLVIPGLINCHTHMYMSIFRNYADDLPFGDWLFGRIMPVEDQLTPEDAYWCNLLSCLEMIRSGTTCFLDMHMFAGQSVRASREAGMRAVISRGLVGEDSGDAGGLARLEQAFAEMDPGPRDLTSFMLAPHAIYTCGRGYLEHVISVAEKKGLGLHIHLSESQNEFDNAMEQYGMTPTRYLDEIGLFQLPTIAAHCVYLTDGDIAILRDRGVSVATNPLSNMKLANGFSPVPKLLENGINVCIGTDGASSNNAMNMFREMSALSYIHKGLSKDALSLPAPRILQMATANGAKALGLEGVTGAIRIGMRADLVILDLNRPNMRPATNPMASLVYSASGAEVETVLIDGEIIMEQGQVKTIDEEKVYFEVEKIRERVL